MSQGCVCGNPCPTGETRCESCRELPGTQPLTQSQSSAKASAPKRSVSPLLPPGTVLDGKWRIESLLGRGGMGSVYWATDTSLLRTVAVKVLTGELAESEGYAARFEREAQLLAAVDHPNIVPVYSVGEHEGRPFFVMKRLTGTTLSERLRHLRFPVESELLRAWMKQICSALQVVHAMGVVHRDLKPANLWIDPQEHVTVLDFGISHNTLTEATTRRVLGSPAYMSPEQIRGQRVTPASDVYALGLLTFQLLTGMLPFQGDNDFALAQQHVTVRAPDCRETSPWVGRQVAAVVARALLKDPAQRYVSAQPFFDALDEALTADARASKKLQWLTRGWWRHRQQLRAVGAVAVLGSLVTAGWFWTRVSPPTPVPEPDIHLRSELTTPALAEPEGVSAKSPEPEPTPSAPMSKPKSERARRVSARPKRELRAPPTVVAPVAPGELRVMTTHAGQPTWGTLFVDGKARGSTPARITLDAGGHQLRIERPGFKAWSQDIQVTSGKPLSLKIELVAELAASQ